MFNKGMSSPSSKGAWLRSFWRGKNCLGFQSSREHFIPIAASSAFHIIPAWDEVTPKEKWDFRRDKMQYPQMSELGRMLFQNKLFSMDGPEVQFQIQLEWSCSCQCIPWKIRVLGSRCLIMGKGRKMSILRWGKAEMGFGTSGIIVKEWEDELGTNEGWERN